MAKAYIGINGLKKIAKKLTGNESVYLGIRPYGFHAGNKLCFIVYPFLLCEEMIRLGKIPNFKFNVFINDYEQTKLEGIDTKKHPFDVKPLDKTFQYSASLENPNLNIVDYWQPIIQEGMSFLTSHFDQIKIHYYRNSELKKYKEFKHSIYQTILHSDEIASVLERNSEFELYNKTGHRFVRAVCPSCFYAKTETDIVDEDHLLVKCLNCSTNTTFHYDDLDFWFYHKPLAVPRLEIFDINLCITGIDHYHEGDFDSRPELIRVLSSKAKAPDTLYTPGILVNGIRMGKSKNNLVEIEIDDLINLAKNTKTSEIHINDTRYP